MNINMAQHITSKDVQEYFYEKFARRRGPLLGYYPNLFDGIRFDSGHFSSARILFKTDNTGLSDIIPSQKIEIKVSDLNKDFNATETPVTVNEDAQVHEALNSWINAIDEGHENV